MKPQKEKVDHCRPQGEEFDRAYTYDYKSRTDDTETSQKLITEKITVSQKDVSCMEQTEKRRYPKDVDIGRIVTEETPEEKREFSRREFPREDHVGQKGSEVTVVQHEDYPKAYVTEDAVKVGKLDVTHLERSSVDGASVSERVKTYRDRVDGTRKV